MVSEDRHLTYLHRHPSPKRTYAQPDSLVTRQRIAPGKCTRPLAQKAAGAEPTAPETAVDVLSRTWLQRSVGTTALATQRIRIAHRLGREMEPPVKSCVSEGDSQHIEATVHLDASVDPSNLMVLLLCPI